MNEHPPLTRGPSTPCPTCDGITWYRRSGRWACPECDPPSTPISVPLHGMRWFLSYASGPWDGKGARP